MKIVEVKPEQKELLDVIYPKNRLSSYLAYIPRDEYLFWMRCFSNLLDGLTDHLYYLPFITKHFTKVPVVQCVAKLVGLSESGYLIPKVFKFGALPEGTIKDFGFTSFITSMLDTLSGVIPHPILKLAAPHRSTCLGILAWNETQLPHPNHRYLSQMMNCVAANRLSELKIHGDRVMYGNREYFSVIPTNNYFDSPLFQKVMEQLDESRLLTLQRNFPLHDLRTLIGFKNPHFAEVRPLDFFLDENPNLLDNYVLLRTDTGAVMTWDTVMDSPKLRLEMEMEHFWLWQDACHTHESLESINLYWEFGMDYPWLIDRRNNSIIPSIIVE